MSSSIWSTAPSARRAPGCISPPPRAPGSRPSSSVGDIARSPVQKALDAGASGIIVPGVETVSQAAALVSYAKFAPLGSRGYCPTRDGGWGYNDRYASGIEDYMRLCNDETMLILQCETAGCLENIEDIASMDGVDGVLIGPFDLSIALGKPGVFDAPEVVNAFRRILSACGASGKPCIIFAGSAETAKRYFDDGFDSVAVGLDTSLYIGMYREIVKNSL